MPNSIINTFSMMMRGSPVRKLHNLSIQCLGKGLQVTIIDLEAHYLAGGNPEKLVEALLKAQDAGVSTSLQELAAIDLCRHDPVEIVDEAIKLRTAIFNTFSPTLPDRIVGFTKNQEKVSASISIIYCLSPSQVAFKQDLRLIHERLGAAVSVFINTASDLRNLRMRMAEHEAQLQSLGMTLLPGLKNLSLEYK